MKTSILKQGMALGLMFSFLAAGAVFSAADAHDDRRDRDDRRYRKQIDRQLDREHKAYHRQLEQQRRALRNQNRYGVYGYGNDSILDRLGRVIGGNVYDPRYNRYDPRYGNYNQYRQVGWNPPGPPPHAAVWRKNPVWQQNNRRW